MPYISERAQTRGHPFFSPLLKLFFSLLVKEKEKKKEVSA